MRAERFVFNRLDRNDRYRLRSAAAIINSMGWWKQPDSAAETRGDRNLKAAALLLCTALAGCASPWANPAPSANSASASTPAVSQTAVSGPPPTASATETAPISDGVHPNRSLSDLFRGSSSASSASSANVANVPHPPSSYTPTGQPYTPSGQPAYGEPQNSGDASTASATDSDGVHPTQSLSDLFRQ
jgi:hypothetical protein